MPEIFASGPDLVQIPTVFVVDHRVIICEENDEVKSCSDQITYLVPAYKSLADVHHTVQDVVLHSGALETPVGPRFLFIVQESFQLVSLNNLHRSHR